MQEIDRPNKNQNYQPAAAAIASNNPDKLKKVQKTILKNTNTKQSGINENATRSSANAENNLSAIIVICNIFHRKVSSSQLF